MLLGLVLWGLVYKFWVYNDVWMILGFGGSRVVDDWFFVCLDEVGFYFVYFWFV